MHKKNIKKIQYLEETCVIYIGRGSSTGLLPVDPAEVEACKSIH